MQQTEIPHLDTVVWSMRSLSRFAFIAYSCTGIHDLETNNYEGLMMNYRWLCRTLHFRVSNEALGILLRPVLYYMESEILTVTFSFLKCRPFNSRVSCFEAIELFSKFFNLAFHEGALSHTLSSCSGLLIAWISMLLITFSCPSELVNHPPFHGTYF